jgi:hypothetical protein
MNPVTVKKRRRRFYITAPELMRTGKRRSRLTSVTDLQV